MMETTLRDLCQRHDLTTASVMYQHEPHNHTTVYLHWREAGEAICASGGGKTYDEALVLALAEMAELSKRSGRAAA